MSRLVDISVPIAPDLPTWPGDPTIRIDPAKRIARGDAANVSQLSLGSHTGTHVDPPSHFLEGGPTIEQLDPAVLVGSARVADLRGAGTEIRPEELVSAAIPDGMERLLIKTSNSGRLRRGMTFDPTLRYLGVDVAQLLLAGGVRLVVADHLAEDRAEGPRAHPV